MSMYPLHPNIVCHTLGTSVSSSGIGPIWCGHTSYRGLELAIFVNFLLGICVLEENKIQEERHHKYVHAGIFLLVLVSFPYWQE